jgi:hypothetical protein
MVAVPAAVLAQPRVTRVPHDGEQPAAPVRAIESCEEFKGAQVSFLHHIFGVMIVARQPTRQVIGSVQMRQDSLFETPNFVRFLQRRFSSLVQSIEDKTHRPAILFPKPN